MTDEPGVDGRGRGRGRRRRCPRDETHLVVRALRRRASTRSAASRRGLALRCANRIPHGRGLGSSAAAIVAGARCRPGRWSLGGDRPARRRRRCCALAAELEGHPDNVAACLLGGFTARLDGRPAARPGGAAAGPAAVVLAGRCSCPTTSVATATARGLLPADGAARRRRAATPGRAALLVARADRATRACCSAATEDRLHQQLPGRGHARHGRAGARRCAARACPRSSPAPGRRVLALRRRRPAASSRRARGWRVDGARRRARGVEVVTAGRHAASAEVRNRLGSMVLRSVAASSHVWQVHRHDSPRCASCGI